MPYKKVDESKHTQSVRIDLWTDELQKLNDLAAELRMSRAQLIRTLLRDALETRTK